MQINEPIIDGIYTEEELLHPLLRERYEKFRLECAKHHIQIYTTCTWRTSEKHIEMFQFARTLPGVQITNESPGFAMSTWTDKEGNPCSASVDFCLTVMGKVPVDFSKYKFTSYVAHQNGLVQGFGSELTKLFVPYKDTIEYDLTHSIYGKDSREIKQLEKLMEERCTNGKRKRVKNTATTSLTA